MDAQERLMRPQRAGRAEEGPPDARVGRPETVRVWLLGGFRVSVGTHTVEEGAWRLRKAAALVKLLALAPGHRLHREQAMDLLWSELGLRAASNNLHQALYVARRTLHPDPAIASRYLSLSGEQLALCPKGRLWVDVEAFEEAAATAHRSREPAAYRAAIELYSGELLPEDRYEEWAESRRQQLRRTFVSLPVELAGLYQERGEEEPAVKALRRVLAEEPANEEAHVGLMRLYALSEKRPEALAQYERLREALSRGLGTEPGPSSRTLREEIASGRFPLPDIPADPAGDGASGPTRHNLPAPRTSFVGRQRELLEIKRSLAMTRLLTLTGAGGSGKTRLALEVARDLVGAYPDGAWLAELALLSEGALVPQAVAGPLRVRERPGAPFMVTLQEALRDKELLLVLDNCEHLIDACAHLAETLLDSCPHLRILATSREALGVSGELNWPVPSLSVPDSRNPLTLKELEGYESARLFAERASYRRPGFALTTGNTQVVAEICRRLDGVPLAIELAAVRVGALSVEQISEKLGDSLGLLATGSRTAVPRQRTLRGALDWSHQLLGEQEQVVFRRLSTFMGGWSLEAAEAVVSGDGVEEGDALVLLSGLVDKSLVVAEATGDGGVRSRLLEPVRQYAREKLEEGVEPNAILRRHAEFFLALAEEAEPELRGQEQAAWFARLEAEHDNMRAALSWAIERKDTELALRLGGVLWRFWVRSGHWSEGRRWLEEALATNGTVASSVRAKGLHGLGVLANMQDDYDQAVALLEESLALYRNEGDSSGIAMCLADLAEVASYRGDLQRAAGLLEEALARFRRFGNKPEIAYVLRGLAHVAIFKGNYKLASAQIEESLGLFREVGDSRGVAGCLGGLAWIALSRGDHERATELLGEATAWYREAGIPPEPDDLMNLGLAAMLRGDQGRATELIREGLVLGHELGDRLIIAWGMEYAAVVAASRARAERAGRLFGAAEALREVIGAPLIPAERAFYEPYVVDARAELGEREEWEATREEGRKMTLEEAIEYALSEEVDLERAPAGGGTDGSLTDLLTIREREVAAMVARGLSNRRLASELHLSERTVENHVRNILKKLKLSSRSEVAAWVEAQCS